MPLTIVMDGTLTGQTLYCWEAPGRQPGWSRHRGRSHKSSGSPAHSIHDVKTLVSPQGTLVLKVQTLFDIAPDGTVTFREGSWQVVEATGAYEGLHAGGAAGAAAESFGSLVTGQIHIRHDGTGHFE